MKTEEMNIIILDEKSYLLKKDNQGEVLPIETLSIVLNYPNIDYTNEPNLIGIAKVVNKENIIKYDLYKTNSLGKTKYSRKFLTREELFYEIINQIKEKKNPQKNYYKKEETKSQEPTIIPKKKIKLLNFFKK